MSTQQQAGLQGPLSSWEKGAAAELQCEEAELEESEAAGAGAAGLPAGAFEQGEEVGDCRAGNGEGERVKGSLRDGGS